MALLKRVSSISRRLYEPSDTGGSDLGWLRVTELADVKSLQVTHNLQVDFADLQGHAEQFVDGGISASQETEGLVEEFGNGMITLFGGRQVQAVVFISGHSLETISDQFLEANVVVALPFLAFQNTILLSLLGKLSNYKIRNDH